MLRYNDLLVDFYFNNPFVCGVGYQYNDLY